MTGGSTGARPVVITRDEFLALLPRARGDVTYMVGQRDDQPNVPDEACPYPDGSAEATQWHAGQAAAAMDAQDGDDG